jgi:hypothetical protein
MSSCLKRYSVCHELNTIDAGRSRSIGGVIIVDAGRSRSTCHGCDAYIHDHCHEWNHNYSLFRQLPNSNVSTHRNLLVSLREKPLVKPIAPGSTFIIFAKTLISFAAIYFYFKISSTITIYLSPFISFNLASDMPRGLTTLLFVLGASLCFLCVVTDDVVLLGTPTGSINLGSHWGKYLSLLYCFTFPLQGKNLTQLQSSRKNF